MQEKYVKEQKASTKSELNDTATLIKEGVLFARIRPLRGSPAADPIF